MKVKVIEQEDLVNHIDEAIEPIREKVLEMVAGEIKGIKGSLERELKGIPLMVMRAMMDLEIASITGPKHKHEGQRRYTRWGSNPGSVAMDGQRIKLRVPRAVEKETKKSYELETYGLFHKGTELIKRAYRDLIRGISTRNYAEGVEKFVGGYGTSSSTISRKMTRATADKLKELMTRRFENLELGVLMIDGVHFGDQTVVIALGIDIKGLKHILGIWQGATENSQVVKNLLGELVDRGLSTEQRMLVVLDGSKALRKAVADVLGNDTPVQRCVAHKKRNIVEQLPKKYQSQVSKRLTKAYNIVQYNDAKDELTDLARELELINPSAARSLEEGMEETLTLHKLRIPGVLRKTLQSTNLIESSISVLRYKTRNVKNWSGGNQTERWVAAGLLEAEENFTRIKGHASLTFLVDALENISHSRQKAA
jgi:transposase-like protein